MVIKVLAELRRRTDEYSEDFNQVRKKIFFKESMRDEEYSN